MFIRLVVNARFLTQSLTGVQRYALEIAIVVKELVDGVVFVCPGPVLNKEAADQLDAQVIGRRKGHLWEQTDLPKFLRQNGNPPLFCPGNTGPLSYDNNYICIHDLAFLHYPQWNKRLFAAWYRMLLPRVARNAKHVFTVSETVKRELITWLELSESRVSVTYNGVASSIKQAKAAMGHIAKKQQILSVGTFNKRKNHDKLIRAFLASPVRQTHMLVIAGSQEQIFEAAGVGDSGRANIRIIERPDDEALCRLYAESAVLVSLSAYEGFGLPILEGLYFDCKVLCSDLPVFHELYEGHIHFCNIADPAAVSAGLNEICKAAIQQAPDWTQRYSYEQSARHIIETITSSSK